VVGALTVSSIVWFFWFLKSLLGQQKTPVSGPLYEGCALILVTMPE